jgi:hypothetical protein
VGGSRPNPFLIGRLPAFSAYGGTMLFNKRHWTILNKATRYFGVAACIISNTTYPKLVVLVNSGVSLTPHTNYAIMLVNANPPIPKKLRFNPHTQAHLYIIQSPEAQRICFIPEICARFSVPGENRFLSAMSCSTTGPQRQPHPKRQKRSYLSNLADGICRYILFARFARSNRGFAHQSNCGRSVF